MTPNYHRTDESSTETREAPASPRVRVEASYRPAAEPPPLPWEVQRQPVGLTPRRAAAGGFAQTFGLLPSMAMLTVAMDVMLHAATVVTAGLLFPLSLGAAGALVFIVLRAQMKWYGDDEESAMIKALIVGLLTAIPSPLPYMLFIPAGIVGFFHNMRRR